MESREINEKRTTIKATTLPSGQTTNANVRPEGGADATGAVAEAARTPSRYPRR
jgi:hypothetical protein